MRNGKSGVFIVAFTMAAALAFSALAARPDVRQMTCAQARALVQASGAIVLTFTNTTYDRVVRNRFYCSSGEYAKAIFKQTADFPRCNIGNICVPGEDIFDSLFKRRF